jgi:hypothetical protein|tara:strand:+ start:1842 stop:2267 length:426 start_codon:yes stop_codon:yes gene_type:complete
MTTKRESIMARLLTVLANTTGVSTRIYRSRTVPLTRGESPALILEPVSDTIEQNTSLPTLDHFLTVRVSVIVRGDIPDSVADATVESLHSKIMADLTVNNLAIDIQPSDTSFELLDADQPGGVIGVEYIVRYRTEINDLTQ